MAGDRQGAGEPAPADRGPSPPESLIDEVFVPAMRRWERHQARANRNWATRSARRVLSAAGPTASRTVRRTARLAERLGRWVGLWQFLCVVALLDTLGGWPDLSRRLHPYPPFALVSAEPVRRLGGQIQRLTGDLSDPFLPRLTRALPESWQWAGGGIYLVCLVVCVTVVRRSWRMPRALSPIVLVVGCGGFAATALEVMHLLATSLSGVARAVESLTITGVAVLIGATYASLRLLGGRRRP
ncbi:hypothetical protein GCM10023322_56550 [Rugosimonospora acidiphila]|uniref:Uncharacterized protein n=1 Tax=Rugosimonospora acidiphila TaxID=556531 RepID=A0ABP9SD43_9ACTN